MELTAEKYIFEIKVNKAKQRVLIVGDKFRFNNFEPVHYDDFDAMIFETEVQALLETQLIWLNPVTSNEFMFKPFFFATQTTKQILTTVCDGLYDSIEDEQLMKEVDRIQKRMIDLSFKVYRHEPEFWTENNIMMGILRFELTRNDQIKEPVLNRGSAFGYMFPLLEIMFKHEYIVPSNFIQFKDDFIFKSKCMEPVKLLNIIHLCPVCNTYNIIFSENCPRCSSVNISMQDMIHHFRCANISPESSYIKSGQLVCPKCSKNMKHIGVDYDRPTDIYTCYDCSLMFSEPIISCTCTFCKSLSHVGDLKPLQIVISRFTNYGKTTLASIDHYFTPDDLAKFETILSINEFRSILRNRLLIHLKGNIQEPFRIFRISGQASDEVLSKVIEMTYAENNSAMMAYKNATLYIYLSIYNTISDESIKIREGQMKEMGFKDLHLSYIEYDKQIDIDEFISII